MLATLKLIERFQHSHRQRCAISRFLSSQTQHSVSSFNQDDLLKNSFVAKHRLTPSLPSGQKFLDRIVVRIKAGNGGKGSVAWRREKYVEFGGPDGGNGGKGGDVIIHSSNKLQSLVHVRKVYKAHSGEPGMGKKRNGHNGEDLIIRVPAGTIVTALHQDEDLKQDDSHMTDDDARAPDLRYSTRGYRRSLLVDLDSPDTRIVLAKGGIGGKGNAHFATARFQSPKFCQPGMAGEEIVVELELKALADVGLVGYPNAGKSTLLAAISRAKPKIAPYPFTTLTVHLGAVDFEDSSRVFVADIPGLIEGAHLNVGLGHDFLRHVERTKVLAYVLDMAGTDGRSPLDDFLSLREEVGLYQKSLLLRPSIIVANKMDAGFAAQQNLERLMERVPLPVFPISASERTGLSALLSSMKELVRAESEIEESAKLLKRHSDTTDN